MSHEIAIYFNHKSAHLYCYIDNLAEGNKNWKFVLKLGSSSTKNQKHLPVIYERFWCSTGFLIQVFDRAKHWERLFIMK